MVLLYWCLYKMKKISIIIVMLMLLAGFVLAVNNTTDVGYEIVETNAINLSSVEILSNNDIYFGEKFKIIARPINGNGTIIVINNLTIDILNVSNIEKETIFLSYDGSYMRSFTIDEQDIENINVSVYTKQGDKIINTTKTFNIISPTSMGNFGTKVEKFGQWLSNFLVDSWLYLIIFGTVFIFIIIAFSLIKKDNKNQNDT